MMPQNSNPAASPFALPARLQTVAPVANRLFGLARCRQIYASLPADLQGAGFIRVLLERMGLQADCPAAERSRIPASGPLLVVANHPFGGAEGLLLADQLLRVRGDVRILANRLLSRIPQLRDLLIPVDPFGGPDAVRSNLGPMRQALRWLKSGGTLIVFPAGEVSHLHLKRPHVSDPPWTEDLAPLVRRSGAAVLPVWFKGSNGPAFQLAGLFHPRLRTALLPRELLNKCRRTLPMRIGKAIPAERLAGLADAATLVSYLRLRTYLLGRRRPASAGGRKSSATPALALAAPQPAARLQDEVARLPVSQRLAGSGDLEVFLAQPRQIPYLLLEMGRLREMTFRGVGEGTGQAFDLDDYDHRYTHLFAWNREKAEVVGGYRLGLIDPAVDCRPERYYTHSLFHYGGEFLQRLGPALELGRSFVRPEYQRHFAPLLLLWKGIGAFVARNPRYRSLFGPVSISRDYSGVSRQLLAGALLENCSLPDLGRLVRPRTPIRLKTPSVPGCDRELLRSLGRSLEDVDELIADLDPEPGGMPVLLRHYLGLGGRVLAFNLDRDFSDVVDALVVVDLAQTERRVLNRYLGRQGAGNFLGFHGVEAAGLNHCA